MYRILRQEDLLTHRERSHPAVHNKPKGYVATGPNQVWSWDITYLCSSVRGQFYYLYLLEDIWSRKIMAAKVHTEESAAHAASLVETACIRHGVDPKGLVLHSDNGGPMKGSTMLATLQKLGVVPSFSRPRVSDDNPFSEALFRTLKYRPEYPNQPFDSLEEAQTWVEDFVDWYNREHKHSAIRFVTPEERHDGRELKILDHRAKVYAAARKANPNRWSGSTRNWTPIAEVNLNVRSSDQETAAEHRSAA
jgi:transposase InsO family protein